MGVLSQEEIEHIYELCRAKTFGQVRAVDFGRMLETRILRKLKNPIEVGWEYVNMDGVMLPVINGQPSTDTKLYRFTQLEGEGDV